MDIDSIYEDPVQLEGRYEVDPIPGGKRFQGACLVLDDGQRYVISYRPVEEHFQFIDKRVIVSGRPYTPGLDVQHIMATHLELHSIDLAPGETPYEVPPTQVPLPPIVRTRQELASRSGCWAQVVAFLEAVEEDPDGYLGLARLRLADGSRVTARYLNRMEWTPFVGQRVRVISRVAREPGSVGGYHLWSGFGPC